MADTPKKSNIIGALTDNIADKARSCQNGTISKIFRKNELI